MEPSADGADRRDPYAGFTYDADLPPSLPRRRSDEPARFAGCMAQAIGGAAVMALVLLPLEAVRYGLPDVHGFIRPVLYLASVVVIIAVIAVLGPNRPGSRAWWFKAMAGAALVLVAGGILPQRRVNAAAAAPRVWPSRPVEDVGMGLVTRWDRSAPVYVVGVRCPGDRDCLAGRRVHVALRVPGRAPTVTLRRADFVRLLSGEYRARVAGAVDGQVRRRDYLAATDWDAWTTRDSTATADTASAADSLSGPAR